MHFCQFTPKIAVSGIRNICTLPLDTCACYTGEGKILTENYSLLPVDLRDLKALQTSLESAGFQPTIPTYVLAECVLVYMEPHESAALLRHLGQQLSSAVCVVYEQVSLSITTTTPQLGFNYQPICMFLMYAHVSPATACSFADVERSFCPYIAHLSADWFVQIHPEDAFGQQMLRNLEVSLPLAISALDLLIGSAYFERMLCVMAYMQARSAC